MTKKSLQAKKNHHYVWAHYLARWSDDGKNVWHTTQTGKIIRDSVRAIARENHFYRSTELTPNHVYIIKSLSSLSPKHLQVQHEAFLSKFLKVQKLRRAYRASSVRDLEAEQALFARECNMMEDLHSLHEGEARTVIDALASGDISILDQGENLENFVAFLGQQMSRTKSFKEKFSSTLPVFSKMGSDALQVHRLIEDCWWFISYMLGVGIGWSLYASRSSDTHCLLINNTKTGFITSDQPVINVHPDLKEGEVVPPTDDTCDFFFPLSPNAAYMINKSDMFSQGINLISEDIAEEMNTKIAKAARTHVVGVDRDAVALYRKHVGTRDAIVDSHLGQL
ncbi:DUF4238 domain-containing protein [uncultured Sulfitobacter sp.]|uniref:DUF4238 domain-containing protein n=1 Tax=uncultured Sulfitobacter sp. TaxID=191468 RepID=UPI0025947FC6|nr:DUF4238 domain-containing protein [uncultured Sulfitobacter sp.]